MSLKMKLPNEVMCDIIKYVPYPQFMRILVLETDFKKVLIDRLNYVVINYIKHRVNNLNYYLLCKSFYYLYNPNESVQKRIDTMIRINYSLYNNFKIDPEYNGIIKDFFDTRTLTPYFIKMFYVIHTLYQFPYDIALDAVDHMDNEKLNQMVKYAYYYNNEEKYNDAYVAVFEDENDHTYSIKHQTKVFEKIVKRAKLSLIDTAYCAGELAEEGINDFFNFIEMGIDFQEACSLVLVSPDYSIAIMNNAFKLIIKHNILVEFAIESSANFNDEQMKLFKTFLKYINKQEEFLYNSIINKSATCLKCLDYLVKHHLISYKNIEFFAEVLSEEQCQKVVNLIEQGVKFYKIIKCMKLENILILLDLQLNSLYNQLSLEDTLNLNPLLKNEILHLNLYEDDENYVEQEYEENYDEIADYYTVNETN
jgi:hypothetical protein